MSLDGYEGPRVLLSYDVVGVARSVAARVCQIVFGRMRMDRGPAGAGRMEAGFIHRPGVVWVGQSVLVLPPADAEDLAGRLRRLGVQVARAPVGISARALEAFRRPARGWA